MDHAAEAERLLAETTREFSTAAALMVAVAQVHALLALAEAVSRYAHTRKRERA